MAVLKISTKWAAGGATDATKIIPLPEGEITIFKSNKATKKDIDKHTNLVWKDRDFGANTPRYFKEFEIVPTDNAILDKLRNA